MAHLGLHKGEWLSALRFAFTAGSIADDILASHISRGEPSIPRVDTIIIVPRRISSVQFHVPGKVSVP